jgi:hypothetical protein
MTKYTDPRPTAVMDTECYRNYWSIAFRDIETKRVVRLRRTPTQELDRQRLAKIMRNWRIVTFKGVSYDLPMIALAMTGATNTALKNASDELILTEVPHWKFMRDRDLEVPDFIDIIDWMEVSPGSPGMPSLKLYAGRLHSKRMQELPFPPDAILSDEDIVVLEDYHDNDLDVTEDGFKELKAQIELRAIMSDEYGVDLRSKSDAQVAEAVIKTEIERITGKRLWKPDVKPGFFQYTPPPYVKFKTPVMQEMLRRLIASKFTIRADGKVVEPPWLAGFEMPMGTGVFRMGIGGLHSSEKKMSQLSDEEFVLLDRDVTSYYPAIILMMRLFPKHIGQVFLKVYRRIFERRLHAKAMSKKCKDAGDSAGALHWGNIAETLKIVLNGSFGKFGSPYSVLFSPDLMIATTITGQLSVLMLIEDLFLRDMEVISANTDGFVTKVPRSKLDLFHAMIFDWECDTGLGTEETEYLALYSQGVNAYLGIDKDGKPKRKGKNFTPAGPGLKGASGMKKNPYVEICALAVIAYLKDRTPLEDTIRNCTDIRMFVAVQRVQGGAEKDGEFVAKALRWYYSTETRTAIYRADNGNTVPRSIGAKVCLEMPDEFPDDIDYDWYEREAVAILEDFGFSVEDPKFEGRTGTFTGLLGDQKTFHTVKLPSGVAVCGKKPKSIRETWKETKTIPTGYRLCSKCVKGGEL